MATADWQASMTDINIVDGIIHFEGYKVGHLYECDVPATVAEKFKEALKNCYTKHEIEQIKAEAHQRGYEQRVQ